MEEKEFVSFEIAVKLKELGFDKKTITWFNPNGCFFWKFIGGEEEKDYTVSVKDIIDFEHYPGYFDAPTYQQVRDWLFDEHSIWITLEHYDHGEPTHKLPRGFAFFIEVHGYCEVGKSKHGYFNDQYEALNKAIEEALKLIEE